MLRLLAASTLIERAIAATGTGSPEQSVFPLIGAAGGLLILCGLWTPVAGVLTAVVEAWIVITHPAPQYLAIMSAGLALSLAMIGPGAWSIDARLYGRKQILPLEP